MVGANRDRATGAAPTPMLTAARTLLFSILVAVPLACAVPQVWGSKDAFTADFFSAPKLLAFSVLVGAATIAWISALARGESALRFPRVLGWLLIGFLGLGLVSAAFGINPPTAFFGDMEQKQGILVWLGYGLMWFLLVQTVSTRADALRAATFAVVGGFLVAAYDLVQMRWLNIATWSGIKPWMAARGVSTVGNPDQLGGYLVLPLMLAVALAIGAERRWLKIAYAVAAATIATALFLTQTRGAWIGAVVGALVLGVALWRDGSRAGRKGVLGLAAAAAGAVVLAFAVRPMLVAELAQRVNGWLNGAAGAGNGRFVIWREALSVIAAHPLLGVGPDSYRLAWYGIRSADLIKAGGFGFYVTEPHDLVLQLAATFGPVAAVLAVALFGLTLWRSRSAITTKVAGAEAMSLAGWWAATLALATYALFGPTPITITAMLMFGMGVLAAAAARKVPEPATGARLASMMLGLAISAVVVWVSIATFAADVELMSSLKDISNGVAHAQKAVSYAPWSTQAKRWLAAAYVNQARTAYNSGNTGQAMNSARNAVGEYEAAIAASPSDLDNYWEYADSLASMGLSPASGFPDVADIARRGLEQDRYALGVAMYGAKSLYESGRFREAAQMLAGIWDIDPKVSTSGVLYARALAGAGDAAGAREVAATLVKRFPGDDDVKALRSELASGTATTP
jgi:O-antigen ligase